MKWLRLDRFSPVKSIMGRRLRQIAWWMAAIITTLILITLIWAPSRMPLTALNARQLAMLADQPQLCLALLEKAGVGFAPIDDRKGPGKCGWSNAVMLESGAKAAFEPSDIVKTCELAAALTAWERDVVQPAAREWLRAEVTGLVNKGSFACRNARDARWMSQHAFARAIDIEGFELSDGQTVTVMRYWREEDSREAAFLRAVHAGACQKFQMVLSPDYDRNHFDHLHFDMGPAQGCH